MKATEELISVKILGKIYKIKCKLGEQNELYQATQQVNEYMNHLQHAQANTVEDLAIVTALNMSHELLLARQKIQRLKQKIQECLVTEEKIEEILL